MDDFYFDIGATVLLRILNSGNAKNKYRRGFLKLFRAIATAFSHDAEFRAFANLEFNTPK